MPQSCANTPEEVYSLGSTDKSTFYSRAIIIQNHNLYGMKMFVLLVFVSNGAYKINCIRNTCKFHIVSIERNNMDRTNFAIN